MHRLAKFDINESMQYRVDPRTIEIVKEMIRCYNMAIETKESRGDQLKVLQCRYYNLPKTGSRWVVYLDDISTGVEVISTEDVISTEGKEYVNWNDIDLSRYEIVYSLEDMYQAIVATCPQGLMKTMRVVTNALQLKSMIAQRSNHKLDEWKYFVKWAKSLYFWRYLDMYQDDLGIDKEYKELLEKVEYLLYHLLENHRYLIYDKDSAYELTHEIVGNDSGDRSLTRLVDKDDVGSISTYDAIKDITDKYLIPLYSTIGQLVSRFHTLFLIYNTGKLMNENKELKEKVKTLENYILQHAHGKISTEELCDKLNK